MLETLKKLKDFGCLGVKSEFEAEGVRQDELLRIVELCYHSDLKIGIKIGGGEAITDMYMAKNIGAEYIIAPMVETSYALSKYILAKNKVWSEEERKNVQFLFNLETITTYNNIEEMMKVACAPNGVDGVVFGRVDFTTSLGLDRSFIDQKVITDYCVNSASLCKKNNMVFVVGGGVNENSITEMRKIHNIRLDRFETRKIIFNGNLCQEKNISEIIKTAVKFELLQLQNKQNYYHQISIEDQNRIQMIAKRLND
jgi:hypothetical protein